MCTYIKVIFAKFSLVYIFLTMDTIDFPAAVFPRLKVSLSDYMIHSTFGKLKCIIQHGRMFIQCLLHANKNALLPHLKLN